MSEETVSVECEVMPVDGKPTPQELNMLLGNNASPDSTKSSRWTDFNDIALQPYTEFWDNNLGLGDNYLNLISKAVILPNHEIQAKIAASYAAMHSIAIKVAPLLFIQGATGTGKSCLSKVLSGLREQHGNKTFGSTSTFSSLRNGVNKFRFKQFIDNQPIYQLDNEIPCLMSIADIKEFFFKDENRYALFRCGWDRSEEIQTISLGNGENMSFYTFCPKIVTSRDSFILKETYTELFRRCLFLHTQHVDKFDALDKAKWYENSVEALEPDNIDWTGCSKHFLDFWYGDNDANLLAFGKLRRQQGNLKKQALLHGISEHEFKANFYVMITTKTLFDLSPLEVIEMYKNHFDYCKQNIIPESEGLPRLISLVVSEFTAPHERMLKTLQEKGIKAKPETLKLKASDFKSKLDYYKSQQGVMFGASDGAISQAMRDLGFHEDKINGVFFWVWNK
jgi:energy-coupling factor transporter ATP-binding protein EcfA2